MLQIICRGMESTSIRTEGWVEIVFGGNVQQQMLHTELDLNLEQSFGTDDNQRIELSVCAKTIFLLHLCLIVHPSREPGWLEGTLDGKTGLIPENYVEFLQKVRVDGSVKAQSPVLKRTERRQKSPVSMPERVSAMGFWQLWHSPSIIVPRNPQCTAAVKKKKKKEEEKTNPGTKLLLLPRPQSRNSFSVFQTGAYHELWICFYNFFFNM